MTGGRREGLYIMSGWGRRGGEGKERGRKMLNHQKLFLDTTKEYTRQINQLLDMAVTADRKQIMQFTLVLNKLKGSLQKLQKQQPKFKKYITDPAKYEALLNKSIP